MVLGALENKPGTAREIVLLNSGAALYVSGLADTVAKGIDLARATVESGAARSKVDEYVATSQRLGG
jgi:anthranilate phosphoribosyltransferase